MNERNLSRRQWIGAASVVATTTMLNRVVRAEPSTPAAIFNVRDFGAKGDGKSLDTAAIQAAIDAAAKNSGGVVLVPAGEFLIGPIELKSNLTLRIAASGTLLGSTDPNQYHPASGIPRDGDHTMGDGNVGLVYAANADNVTLEGPGTIDGQGLPLRANGLGGGRRAHLTLFYRCTNLKIRDIYLYHSNYHTCRICNCTFVNLDGIRIFCRTVGNNDGFHFISAQHVTMKNCDVRCQDDACALFGSCQFVTITNSSFSTRWSVFRFGGGIAENIAVSNCLLHQVFGCPIKLRCEPGSRYENMSFSNLILQEVTGPISIGAGPMRRSATEPATTQPGGIVRNISFHNISGTVITQQDSLDDSTFASSKNAGEMHSCIILNAVDGIFLENISFSDINLTFGGGGTADEAARRELPQIAGEYFALGPMPAYGLMARNVHGLSISNMRLQVSSPDLRPAMVLDRVQDATISSLSADGNPAAESVLRFMNCQDVYLQSPRVLTPASVFLRVEGNRNHAITVDGGDLKNTAQPLVLADNADKNSVRLRT